jgi:hypothetical protein
MEDRIRRNIASSASWKELDQIEANIKEKGFLSDAIVTAINARSNELGLAYIVENTGIDPSDLSPAEHQIVLAISEYGAILKRQGKTPTYTLRQIRRLGLIGAAETAVCHTTPTQGFQVLADADLKDLSYERIILDHADEFSPRALWYARRTLGLSNITEKAPPPVDSDVNTRTAQLLTWLSKRAAPDEGIIPPFTNAEAAAAIGLGELRTFGRVHGNIQSRIDFACYLSDLPPLGCAAIAPFEKAWGQDGRSWAFPVKQLQQAAQGHIWTTENFNNVRAEADKLPGIAHLPWRDALQREEHRIRAWVNRWANSATSSTLSENRHLLRLPAEVLSQATPEFIWAAVQLFVAGEVNHAFGPSTDFDVVVDQQRFPPKAVFGVALSLALGGKAIEPKHFSAGEGSACFRLLREAGYSVIPKDQGSGAEDVEIYPDPEWREGDRKLVQHLRRERAVGLSKAKKAQHRRMHQGALICERCGDDPVKTYGTEQAESCIEVHHNKVQVSDMAPGHVTSLDDLQCLCANCHRLVHRLMAIP